MLDRDVTNELHHVYGFTYTRTTEDNATLLPLANGHEVDNFDTGFQQFLRV